MQSLSNLEQRIDEMSSDMRDMRASMSTIAQAMTKLAVMEEKNQAQAHALEKLQLKIERLEAKTVQIELEQVKFQATADGIAKTIRVNWVVFGAGVIALGGKAIQFLLTMKP